MKRLVFLWFSVCSISAFYAQQQNDSLLIRSLFDEVLLRGECYENLRTLCKDIGHRISGSDNAEKAVRWGKDLLEDYGMDTVYLQEVMVPKWVRGPIERMEIKSRIVPFYMAKPTALGGSIGTEGTLKAEVVEVKSFDELEALGKDKIEGKLVFYNRPMNPTLISTFHAYSGCSEQRWKGAVEAAKYGAVGTIVRSLTLNQDQYAHTGSMGYLDAIPKIPSVAISTNDAHNLAEMLKEDFKTKVELTLSCQSEPDVQSYNVIAEIKGSEFPEEIIVVGGHLDSWDIGEGAHDDGAGVVQSIEVLRLFKQRGIRPKRTIRCILFMNEENGNRGGRTYADQVKKEGEKHLMALETDRGGFTPRGFSIDGTPEQIAKIQSFEPLLQPYNLHLFKKGFPGVDISPLKDGKICLVGLVPDSQRYFDFHHSAADVFEAVNKRELELGAASMAALIYLVDQYGF